MIKLKSFLQALLQKKSNRAIYKALQSDRIFDCAGVFPLGAAAALIGKLHLLVTPDTGPLHIATALKTPTIGLFAVADPKNSNACYDTDIHLLSKNLVHVSLASQSDVCIKNVCYKLHIKKSSIKLKI